MPSVGDEGDEGRAAAGPKQRVDQFDTALFGHIGFAISNAVRSWWYGLTVSHRRRAGRRRHPPLLPQAQPLFGRAGGDGRHLDAAARRQAEVQKNRSGRLGGVLSQLYIASAMLKRHQDEGSPAGDQPLLAYAFHDAINKIETALSTALRNFPIRPVAWLLWPVIFPWGRRARRHGRSPQAQGRVPADDPVRRARPPRRRRVHHPGRAQPGRAHRQLPAEVRARRAGGTQVPQGAEEQRHRGAGVSTRSSTKACARAGSPPTSASSWRNCAR